MSAGKPDGATDVLRRTHNEYLARRVLDARQKNDLRDYELAKLDEYDARQAVAMVRPVRSEYDIGGGISRVPMRWWPLTGETFTRPASEWRYRSGDQMVLNGQLGTLDAPGEAP